MTQKVCALLKAFSDEAVWSTEKVPDFFFVCVTRVVLSDAGHPDYRGVRERTPPGPPKSASARQVRSKKVINGGCTFPGRAAGSPGGGDSPKTVSNGFRFQRRSHTCAAPDAPDEKGLALISPVTPRDRAFKLRVVGAKKKKKRIAPGPRPRARADRWDATAGQAIYHDRT